MPLDDLRAFRERIGMRQVDLAGALPGPRIAGDPAGRPGLCGARAPQVVAAAAISPPPAGTRAASGMPGERSPDRRRGRRLDPAHAARAGGAYSQLYHPAPRTERGGTDRHSRRRPLGFRQATGRAERGFPAPASPGQIGGLISYSRAPESDQLARPEDKGGLRACAHSAATRPANPQTTSIALSNDGFSPYTMASIRIE